MRRMLIVLAGFYRRWKYVEEEPSSAGALAIASAGDETDQLRLAIEQEERLLADYRRNGCQALARERETTLRSLKTRLSALGL
jgi:hypothetical protein